jgi:curli production assembly/transport component CsgG
MLWAALLINAVGCGNYMSQQPLSVERARLGTETPLKKNLLNLPAPREKIVAAVYKFRDQTGQYKPSDYGSNWSTAVTQGATTILIRALDESGWFIPIERENINNLLNERKIIRSSRAQYEGKESDLPPLLFAGIILEGGIISYETNVLTGGIGIKYFGIGANSQYRMDRVTVYLRAVSSTSGAILKTVYTSKSILSQQVKADVYKYVSLKRILEAETGYTYNEPSELAVSEAIEKAVESLVVEGLRDKLWQLKIPQDTLSASIATYWKEKRDNINLDEFGNNRILPQQTAGQVRIGLSGGIEQYNGDFGYSQWRPMTTFNSDITLTKSISFGQNIGYHYLFVEQGFYDRYIETSVDVKITPLPYHRGSPLIVLKSGANFSVYNANKDRKNNFFPFIGAELGGRYRINKDFSLNLTYFYNYQLTDMLDNVSNGNQNDKYWGVKFGIFYHLGY